nr:hypothetical protein [Tanacetum cinerariifolium]
MLAEESRSKMIKKQNDPQMIEKKVIMKLINYAILNQLSTDFETRFVPQTESSAEQAFRSQYSVQTDEPNVSGTIIVEVPKELPKVSMRARGGWNTPKCLYANRTGLTEVQNVFTQIELAVEQHCEEKSKVQTKMENVLQENDRLLTQALSVEIVNIVVHDKAQAKDTVILNLKEKLNSLNGDVKNRDEKRNVEESETLNIELGHQVNLKSTEVSDLNVRLQEKVLVITALKEQLDKLKGKAVITEAVSLNPIEPKLLKVDVTLVVLKLRKNRTAHIDYIRHTQGEAATLRKIVESERLLSPLDTSLDYA